MFFAAEYQMPFLCIGRPISAKLKKMQDPRLRLPFLGLEYTARRPLFFVPLTLGRGRPLFLCGGRPLDALEVNIGQHPGDGRGGCHKKLISEHLSLRCSAYGPYLSGAVVVTAITATRYHHAISVPSKALFTDFY